MIASCEQGIGRIDAARIEQDRAASPVGGLRPRAVGSDVDQRILVGQPHRPDARQVARIPQHLGIDIAPNVKVPTAAHGERQNQPDGKGWRRRREALDAGDLEENGVAPVLDPKGVSFLTDTDVQHGGRADLG